MAGKIYLAQPLTIDLDAQTALAGATVAIGYRKPDGSTGSWSGAIQDSTKVRVVLAAGVLDQVGTWRLQNEITLAGAMTPGETYQMEVLSRWT